MEIRREMELGNIVVIDLIEDGNYLKPYTCSLILSTIGILISKNDAHFYS